MKRILISLILTSSLVFSLEDLGTYEGAKSIEGKSFFDEIKERINDLDIKKIEEGVKKEKRKSFNLGEVLPECTETKTREYKPTVKFDNDLIMPYTGKVLFKKNEEVNILKHLNINFPYYFLFADASSEVQKELAYALNGKAMIMFTNGDIFPFVDKEQQVFIARKEFEINSFNIKCVPSIVAQNNDKFIINEYNPKDLLKKDNE